MICKQMVGMGAVAFFSAGSVLGLVACSDDAFPDYNYKMTIHVGEKAFSSVRRIEQEGIASVQSSSGRDIKRRLQGEAVAIDLEGRSYYALLTRPDNSDFSLLTVTAASLGPLVAANDGAITSMKGAHLLPRTIPNNDKHRGPPVIPTWPMFVTFDDPQNPQTLREVSPDSIGVDKITISITDEDVTTGIERRFSWWEAYRRRRFDGSSSVMQDMTTSDIRHSITTGAFSTGKVE
jgi:hypothetical protein